MNARHLVGLVSGALFGLGLMVSGMTDPAKVLGWLDVFGAWDPTLGFVLGGAVLPMAAAWRLSAGRRPLLAPRFPAPPPQVIDRPLIAGSVLFGTGWGMAGLCPGPALASIGYADPRLWLFTGSMIAAMALMPRLRRRLDAGPATG
ncbi:DUF6691 family protein [Mangrovicoccus algicola]|uniref:YeeE/YedE family protein n=1 Tax=Mangrovicoccus algicola TaxID=2771008 RepID=A0A8J6YX32_9RHOB|nr:DUF6691 family protein [Mangrovicoccus algicola]MBE3639202.1 hypothetical protein [Mangrovicoccus algicola]